MLFAKPLAVEKAVALGVAAPKLNLPPGLPDEEDDDSRDPKVFFAPPDPPNADTDDTLAPPPVTDFP